MALRVVPLIGYDKSDSLRVASRLYPHLHEICNVMTHFHDVYLTPYRVQVRLLGYMFVSEGRPWRG